MSSAPPQGRIIHSPSTGNFRCHCGLRLSFGNVRGAFALLKEQRREGKLKIGTCPECGRVHQFPPKPRISEAAISRTGQHSRKLLSESGLIDDVVWLDFDIRAQSMQTAGLCTRGLFRTFKISMDNSVDSQIAGRFVGQVMR